MNNEENKNQKSRGFISYNEAREVQNQDGEPYEATREEVEEANEIVNPDPNTLERG